MTYSKTEEFDDDLQRLAAIAKAMSHPARLAILRYLAKTKTCMSGDISKEIPLSRTTVSQHLQELKKAKLIKGETEGVKINYCLCHQCISEIINSMNSFFNELNTRGNVSC